MYSSITYCIYSFDLTFRKLKEIYGVNLSRLGNANTAVTHIFNTERVGEEMNHGVTLSHPGARTSI